MKTRDRDPRVTPYQVEVQNMIMRAAVILLTLGIVIPVSARQRDFLARFDGGIGVIPATNATGGVNIVRGVKPAPGPWRIASLRADIDIYGQVKVRGRGLLIANGDNIGTNLNQSVFATLLCEVNNPVDRSTNRAGVALEANGDFRIDDTLDQVPVECPNPVLLIRSTGGVDKVWFAAGIPKLTDED
jgi:hypothetical protein